MKKTWSAALAAITLAACGGGGDAFDETAGSEDRMRVASAAPAGAPPPSAALPGEVVVMLATGVNAASFASSYRASVLDQFGQRPIYRLKLAAGASVDRVVERMRRDARVRFAEPNFQSETPEGTYAIAWAYGAGEAGYASQWAPGALALPQAHALSIGAGVRVAVLDSGADLAHPALSAHYARTASGAVLGFDFVDFDSNPSEVGGPADRGWGHGTHVAGLVKLAAPGAKIMPVRVLDRSGRGNLWVLAEAILWAVDPDANPFTDDGAHVVNISLGTTRETRLLNTAVELATCSDDDENEADDDYSDPGFQADRDRCNTLHGTVVMAAAGNGGNATETIYPAAEAAEGQLAIGATQQNGTLASISNRGPWVQLAAPGDKIVSTMPGGQYATWTGTSMATPLAAGVAALVLAANPDWKPIDVSKRLTERSVRVCGTEIRGLHAHGALADFMPADPLCP